MGVNEDFDRLQAVAQQGAPQPHHGIGVGTVATVGTIAALSARQFRLEREVQQGLRPKNLKDSSVLGWYLMAAVPVHFLTGFLPSSGLVFWLVFGSLVWIPAWILGIRHQIKNRAANRVIWDRFNQHQASTPPPPVQPSFLDQWREGLRRDSGN